MVFLAVVSALLLVVSVGMGLLLVRATKQLLRYDFIFRSTSESFAIHRENLGKLLKRDMVHAPETLAFQRSLTDLQKTLDFHTTRAAEMGLFALAKSEAGAAPAPPVVI